MHIIGKTWLPCLAAAVLSSACSTLPWQAQRPAAAAPSETARLNQWLDARYEEELRFSPIQLTFLGRKALYDQVDDVSEAAEDRQLAWQAQTVAELKRAFDRAALSPAGRLSYDAWIFRYEQARAARPFRRHDYIFDQENGAQVLPPSFLINFHKVDDADDMRAYIARIRGFARATRQLLERAQRAAAEGIRPPRFAYDGAIEQAARVIRGAPFGAGDDTALWADAKAKVDALLAGGEIRIEQAIALKAQARAALRESFGPAYHELIAWLERDREQVADQAHGASALPDGAAWYAQSLAWHTTTDMSADEIHALGLAEVARIRREMLAIKQAQGFDGDLPAFFRFVREDPQFYYPDTDAGRQAYLDDSAAFLDAIEARLPAWFGLLPKAELVVRRVEAFRERPGGAQHYYPGTPDGSRPGVYYAHLSDMSAYSKADMETTAYHEGSPGHHMQISIAQERQGLPQFRRQAHFSVYTEGWALYAEKLAAEMGAFENPYNRFGQLNAEMWRAIRLVVDTGLHAGGWSQARAVQFFLDNSAIPEPAVRSEVRRYLVTPGQATSYKVGMLKIQQLRAGAREALGERFDIRGFHDAVLGGGALPLPLLAQRVADWVESVKAGG